MTLWGQYDAANSAPKNQVATGLGVSQNGVQLYANSTISGLVNGLILGVDGTTSAEKANANSKESKAAHSGWNLRREGTGPVSNVQVTSGGNYNANGFIIFTGGGGSGANASYTFGLANTTLTGTVNVTTGNSTVVGNGTSFLIDLALGDVVTIGNDIRTVANINSNTIITTTANWSNTYAAPNNIVRTANTILSVTVLNPGSNYNAAPTGTATGGNTRAATFTVNLGGRAGRVHYETLVAMNSLL